MKYGSKSKLKNSPLPPLFEGKRVGDYVLGWKL